MANLVGKTLGKYKLTELLGRGGMAEVYKAIHPVLDRAVTIKILHSFLAEGEDFLARFKREARAVALLRHAHIQQIHDFDIEDDHYYMVMEYIDWGTLQKRMQDLAGSGRTLPARQVLSILEQVAAALDYAHARGILHRDIKPSNILLDSAGNAFLSDFGIARMLSETQFTATGSLIGTPTYMSPEQGRGDELTSATDIYSLGIILYEMLTGKVPFTSTTTPLAIIHKHVNESPQDPRRLRPDLPIAAARVVLQALAKDPGKRHASAGALYQALAEALPEDAVTRMDAVAAVVPLGITEQATELIEPAQAEEIVPEAAAPLPASEPAMPDGISAGQDAVEQPTELLDTPGTEEHPPEPAAPLPASAEEEHVPPPAPARVTAGLPAVLAPERTAWIILLAGLGFFLARTLLEGLAELTGYFGMGVCLASVEIIAGIFGACAGVVLWLVLRLAGYRLGGARAGWLIVTWAVSYLLLGGLPFLIDPNNGTFWTISSAIAGLAGGAGTGLLLSKAPFRIRKVLLLAGAASLYVLIENIVSGHCGLFLPSPLRIGLADLLTGILLAWTLLRWMAPGLETGSAQAQAASWETSLLLLVAGWTLVRAASENFFGLFFPEEAALDLWHPQWFAHASLTLACTGLLSGALLWLALKRMHILMRKRAALLLPLVWAGGFLFGCLVPGLLRLDHTWLWSSSLAAGAALAGWLTARLIQPEAPAWGWRRHLGVALGFGTGAFLGNMILSFTWGGLCSLPFYTGLMLSSPLQSASAALVGGALLIGLLGKTERKPDWRVILYAAMGFTLTGVIEAALYSSVMQNEALHWVVYLSYALCGAALTLPSRRIRAVLLFSSLSALGFLCGKYLWLGLYDFLYPLEVLPAFYLLLGICLGVFLSLGRRFQQAALLACTASLAFLLTMTLPPGILMEGVKLGIVGAFVGLAGSVLGIVPVRAARDQGA